jgi:hypothetical protein
VASKSQVVAYIRSSSYASDRTEDGDPPHGGLDYILLIHPKEVEMKESTLDKSSSSGMFEDVSPDLLSSTDLDSNQANGGSRIDV